MSENIGAVDAAAPKGQKEAKVEPVRTDRFGVELGVGSVVVYIGASSYKGGNRELCAGRVVGFTPKMARVVPIVFNRSGRLVTPKDGSDAYVTRPFSQISVASSQMQEMFAELNVDGVPTEWLQEIMN